MSEISTITRTLKKNIVNLHEQTFTGHTAGTILQKRLRIEGSSRVRIKIGVRHPPPVKSPAQKVRVTTSSCPVISPLAGFAFRAFAGQSNTSQAPCDLPTIRDLERRSGRGPVTRSADTLLWGNPHSKPPP